MYSFFHLVIVFSDTNNGKTWCQRVALKLIGILHFDMDHRYDLSLRLFCAGIWYRNIIVHFFRFTIMHLSLYEKSTKAKTFAISAAISLLGTGSHVVYLTVTSVAIQWPISNLLHNINSTVFINRCSLESSGSEILKYNDIQQEYLKEIKTT